MVVHIHGQTKTPFGIVDERISLNQDLVDPHHLNRQDLMDHIFNVISTGRQDDWLPGAHLQH